LIPVPHWLCFSSGSCEKWKVHIQSGLVGSWVYSVRNDWRKGKWSCLVSASASHNGLFLNLDALQCSDIRWLHPGLTYIFVSDIRALQLAMLPDLILISIQNGREYIFSFKHLLNV